MIIGKRLLVRSVLAGALAAAAARTSAQGRVQDNSFLLEEAYNQESRVVQHVGTFARGRDGSWVAAFSQEWPVKGQRHQLSYTVQLRDASPSGGTAAGLGDAALHYRLQLVGSGASRRAVAPRLSLLLPTGSARRGLGGGVPALQFNLPASLQLSGRIAAHTNLGLTRGLREPATADQAVNAWLIGQSLVWEQTRSLNALVEVTWGRSEVPGGGPTTTWTEEVVVSPGLRYAHDLPSGVQIVPGIALPIGIGSSRRGRGLFVYLSVEHALGHR